MRGRRLNRLTTRPNMELLCDYNINLSDLQLIFKKYVKKILSKIKKTSACAANRKRLTRFRRWVRGARASDFPKQFRPRLARATNAPGFTLWITHSPVSVHRRCLSYYINSIQKNQRFAVICTREFLPRHKKLLYKHFHLC